MAYKEDDSRKVNEEYGVKTIYVSGIKETTTKDSVCLFFENKRRTGGGELCDSKQGYKRISPTVARLTFLSSKGSSTTSSLYFFESFNDCQLSSNLYHPSDQ